MEGGGALVPSASLDVEGAHSHGPGGRALSMEVGSLEEGVCPLELFITCESSKSWQELVSRIWNFFLKAFFSGSSESAPLIFQEPCEQVASIYCAAAECPVVRARLPLRPAPFPLWWTRCLLCFVSHRRHWDQEVLRGQKDAQEPSLVKAIINTCDGFLLKTNTVM